MSRRKSQHASRTNSRRSEIMHDGGIPAVFENSFSRERSEKSRSRAIGTHPAFNAFCPGGGRPRVARTSNIKPAVIYVSASVHNAVCIKRYRHVSTRAGVSRSPPPSLNSRRAPNPGPVRTHAILNASLGLLGSREEKILSRPHCRVLRAIFACRIKLHREFS